MLTMPLFMALRRRSCPPWTRRTRNFSFSHSVFKSFVLQTRQKPGFVWKRIKKDKRRNLRYVTFQKYKSMPSGSD